MKKLLIPLFLTGSLIAAPAAMAADDSGAKAAVVVLTTSDGKKVRAVIHPEDLKHVQGAKKGDKVELFLDFAPSLLGGGGFPI